MPGIACATEQIRPPRGTVRTNVRYTNAAVYNKALFHRSALISRHRTCVDDEQTHCLALCALAVVITIFITAAIGRPYTRNALFSSSARRRCRPFASSLCRNIRDDTIAYNSIVIITITTAKSAQVSVP